MNDALKSNMHTLLSGQEILKLLPQQNPFRFVDEIIHVDENAIEGKYRFKNDEYFYRGHFLDNPVTPGVILTECMAQIGLVCFGIYIIGNPKILMYTIPVFSESQMIFLKIVRPGELVTVKASKIYWRRNKLKCKVNMYSEQEDTIAEGTLSGMFIQRETQNNY
jgi:3-hydroxyacyl-[acyl-carrier-protein] dehydratase